MARNLNKRQLSKIGLYHLSPAEGVECLNSILTGSAAIYERHQLLALSIEFPTFSTNFWAQNPVMSEIAHGKDPQQEFPNHSIHNQEARAYLSLSSLTDLVMRRVEAILGTAPDSNAPLMSVGLD